MSPRSSIEFCPKCNEVTPHEDRRLGRWISVGLGLAGIALLIYFGWPDRWFWIGLLVYLGAWFALDRRQRDSGRRCTRCRHKAQKAWRRTQPDPRNSTIDI